MRVCLNDSSYPFPFRFLCYVWFGDDFHRIAVNFLVYSKATFFSFSKSQQEDIEMCVCWLKSQTKQDINLKLMVVSDE